MEYKEILDSARTCIGPYCKACPVCNGKACGNQVPGPGAKAPGSGFIRNFDAWRNVRLNMDTIHENFEPDTSLTLFGRSFKYPFFAGPVGAMALHYGDKYDDLTYNDLLVSSCAKSGVLAFTGDGTNHKVMEGAAAAITACGGTAQPNPPAQTGDDASQTETPDTAPEPAEEPEEPQQKPYVISSPTVDRGTVDGVTYVPWDGVVEHLFFHPIVAYPELAFDGDSQADGIDDWMVTVDEYDKILQSVYDRGYVLVDINDVWSESTDANGQPVMIRNTLYIPEGKKPLIFSYDDVNYYDYMLKDGFTYKLILGEDGLLWSYGLDPQGNEVISQDLDAVTILDKFVREHPDFSPFGAKGSLSLTGYQGILGYRTNTDTKVWNDELEANRLKECEAVKPIIAELKRTGWTFGSHTWGHINLSSSSLERVKADTKRWMDEVGSLVGPTPILYYPHGARPDGDDVQSTGPIFKYLQEQGFRVFASVGISSYSKIKTDICAVICDRLHPDGTTLRGSDKVIGWYSQFYDARDIIDLDVRPNRGVKWTPKSAS